MFVNSKRVAIPVTKPTGSAHVITLYCFVLHDAPILDRTRK